MLRTSLSCASLALLPVGPLCAQASELQELVAGDGLAQDHFGVALSLCADRALVGAELDDHSGRTDAGSAYVFERSGAVWAQVAKLGASDRAAGDHFGTAVALAGELALVGADGDDDLGSFSGSAYVFERDPSGTWLERAKLHAGDGAASDIFGDALALSGTRILVGAPGHSALGSGAGAAYVFERQANGAWLQVAELAAADAAPGAFFGSAVALAGERALVAAFSDDERAPDAGAVYLFELRPTHPGPTIAGRTPGGRERAAGWRQVAKLTASDASAGAAFGSAVALSGTRLVAGAFGDDQRGADAGAAYVFERLASGAWIERAKLTAPDGAASDFFGASVALSGERALISAVGDDDLGLDSGSTHVFRRDPSAAWNWSQKLTASDGTTQDGFGSALAATGGLALIGAPQGDGAVSQSGTAYLFDLGP